MSSNRRRHIDFEINLIPFIDLLSVCICFLLLTAVWLQVGSLNVKQAVGGQAASESLKKPTMWVLMGEGGEISLDVRDAKIPAGLVKQKVAGKDGRPDFDNLEKIVSRLRQSEPMLVTALLQPVKASVYEDIIDLMDRFKKSGIIDLGVSPL